MEGHYRVLIENGSKRIEIESNDQDWLEKQKKELVKSLRIFDEERTLSFESSSKRTAQAIDASERLSIPRMTINEFYRKYCTGLKSNTDKAVFFLYYLSQVENNKAVSTNEVKELFIRVGIPRANNFNYADVLARAKKRALLNYIDNSWSLTITGEDFVVNRIQGISAT